MYDATELINPRGKIYRYMTFLNVLLQLVWYEEENFLERILWMKTK